VDVSPAARWMIVAFNATYEQPKTISHLSVD